MFWHVISKREAIFFYCLERNSGLCALKFLLSLIFMLALDRHLSSKKNSVEQSTIFFNAYYRLKFTAPF